MAHKLGRRPPDYTKPRLWAEDYYKVATLPHPQPVVNFYDAQFPMYENDVYGDCTIAGMGHLYGAASQYTQSAERLFTNTEITAVYERNGPGFNPIGDVGDDGCEMQAVLQDQTAFGMTDTTGYVNTVSAYAQMKGMGPKDLNVALQLFGGVYCGVNLPQSADTQFPNPWTYVQGSPILGGHCILLAGWDSASPYPYVFVSWGATVLASQEWVSTYLEEAWVAITPDWELTSGLTITGVDIAQLTRDMNASNL